MEQQIIIYQFRSDELGQPYLLKALRWFNFRDNLSGDRDHGLNLMLPFWREVKELGTSAPLKYGSFGQRREIKQRNDPKAVWVSQLCYPKLGFLNGDYVVIKNWQDKKYHDGNIFNVLSMGASDAGWVLDESSSRLTTLTDYNQYRVRVVEFVGGIAGLNIANIELIFYRMNHLDFCFWEKYDEDTESCQLAYCVPQYGFFGAFSKILYPPKAPSIVRKDVDELNKYYKFLSRDEAAIYFSKTIGIMLQK